MARKRSRTMPYTGNFLILVLAAVGCLLVSADTAAIGLSVIAVLNVAIGQSQLRPSGIAASWMSWLLPPRTQPGRATLSQVHEKTLALATNVLKRIVFTEVALVLVAWAANFTATNTLIFVIALAVALLPSGLLGELAVITGYGTRRSIATNAGHALQATSNDNYAQVLLLIISIGCFISFHIPLAVTALQLVVINGLLQAFPIATLAWDDLVQYSPRVTATRKHQALAFALLSAVLVYANFLLFFARHHVSPVHLDTANFLYPEATSLVLITLVGCQFTNLLLVRASNHEKFFIEHLAVNKKLFMAFIASLLLCALIIYTPGINSFFKAGFLTADDWLSAVITTGLYLGLRLFQRHTSKHSRQAILALHHQVGKVV